ncbi:MAG: hypothetical protein QM758_06275 [Armatimonas sp.]
MTPKSLSGKPLKCPACGRVLAQVRAESQEIIVLTGGVRYISPTPLKVRCRCTAEAWVGPGGVRKVTYPPAPQ